MERARILIAEPERFSPRALEILRRQADVELRAVPPGQLAEALRDYDAVFIRLGHRVREADLPAGLRCRVLACPATGLDHIDMAACAQRRVKVVSLRGETAFLRTVRATAEHTLALMFALLRRVPAAHASVAAGRWSRDAFAGREIHGKTAGVVGVGRLGLIVAGMLRDLGMTVLGYDPRPDFPKDQVTRIVRLTDLLGRADVVTVHVALTQETEDLLDRSALAAMKPGAILINTSRGAVIDESALLEALEGGKLAGAALDVLAGEPDIGPDHPLVAYARTHDNLIITPHLGGNTAESFEKTEVFIAEKLLAALDATRPKP